LELIKKKLNKKKSNRMKYIILSVNFLWIDVGIPMYDGDAHYIKNIYYLSCCGE